MRNQDRQQNALRDVAEIRRRLADALGLIESAKVYLDGLADDLIHFDIELREGDQIFESTMELDASLLGAEQYLKICENHMFQCAVVLREYEPEKDAAAPVAIDIRSMH